MFFILKENNKRLLGLLINAPFRFEYKSHLNRPKIQVKALMMLMGISLMNLVPIGFKRTAKYIFTMQEMICTPHTICDF